MNRTLSLFEQIIYKEINESKYIDIVNKKLKLSGSLIFISVCISVITFIISEVYIKQDKVPYIILMSIGGGVILISLITSFVLIFINNQKIKKYFQNTFEQKKVLLFSKYELIDPKYKIRVVDDQKIKVNFRAKEKIIEIKIPKIKFNLIKYISYYESLLLASTRFIAKYIEETIKNDLC